MGLYKICEHKGRARDRCDHAWWGSFRGKRVSLEKWANRDIKTKTAAGKALDGPASALRACRSSQASIGLQPNRSSAADARMVQLAPLARGVDGVAADAGVLGALTHGQPGLHTALPPRSARRGPRNKL